jgi:hypothetical protein
MLGQWVFVPLVEIVDIAFEIRFRNCSEGPAGTLRGLPITLLQQQAQAGFWAAEGQGWIQELQIIMSQKGP